MALEPCVLVALRLFPVNIVDEASLSNDEPIGRTLCCNTSTLDACSRSASGFIMYLISLLHLGSGIAGKPTRRALNDGNQGTRLASSGTEFVVVVSVVCIVNRQRVISTPSKVTPALYRGVHTRAPQRQFEKRSQ